MSDPSPLLLRILELERKVDALATQANPTGVDIERAWANVVLTEAMAEHVIMPAILLLAGYGHHPALLSMLEAADDEIRHHPRIDEGLREEMLETVAGWQRAASAVPRWSTPDHATRHPDLYPDRRE